MQTALRIAGWWLVGGIALAGGCSCGPDADAPPATGHAAAADSAASTSDPAAADAQAVAPAAGPSATDRARADALRYAVETTHAYLQAIGSGETSRAEGYWARGRSPRPGEEADLRALGALRSLRISNQTPEPIGDEPVPSSVRVPVELRALQDDGNAVRYRGWYRLRRDPAATGGWSIAAVSLQRLP